MVTDPGGNHLICPYYDPRVLSVYLPTCTAVEIRMIFGPIDRFWIEDDTHRALLAYTFDGVHLTQNGLSLDDAECIRTQAIGVAKGCILVEALLRR
jgi:hypothetical protein